MSIVLSGQSSRHNQFQLVADAFLQDAGLPLARTLEAADIARAFAGRDALFGQQDVFSTQIVLWAFLAQVLRDGKGAACAQAVADIATYQQQVGAPVPSGDTGDYCRARGKLDLAALRELVGQTARQLEASAPEDWLWHGRHAKLVDGFAFTMPDTPQNQAAFPQGPRQAPGVGLPIARACVVLSLATAAICDLAVGPCAGKQTGEPALLRQLLAGFDANDVVVFDRCFCSYWMLALLIQRGVAVCGRLHQCRHCDFRRGRRLGHRDHLATWTRPERPEWMSPEMYAQRPQSLTLRELEFTVAEPGRRSHTLIVVTTLTDPEAYPKPEIADLYGCRWNVELDIRSIKQTLGLDHARCKTPAMVLRQLWVTLLAYNLIRKVIATAAALHGRQPRQLGFTLACQTILSSWMLLATGACRDTGELWRLALARIAANPVADRPGRIEPRVLKRRRHRYPLMKRSRQALRKEIAAT